MNYNYENNEQSETSNTNANIQVLHSLFKSCLDILRNDAEHLIGDEALHELSHFLILKQAEKHILSGTIDIYDLKYYYEAIDRYGKDEFLKFLEYVKFSKLVEFVKIPEKEGAIKHLFDEFLWDDILCKHPKFKDVFEHGKKSFIKECKTIKKLVIALSDINFDEYDYDILGEAYESIFVDAVFGAGGNKKSELGQFFTPPKVKKLLVNLVKPKLKDNGDIESVLDPASGTGGILNTIIKYFKKLQRSNNISDDIIRTQLINNIYGIEIKGKIFNLCLSNMLINTGEILPNVICEDSIRKYHNIKVDIIVANPPFSVTIKYDDLLSSLGGMDLLNDYIPIKAGGKNSEILFLQMMIHCLNINGRCATVMLDGQKMYGASSGYDKVREYLMRSCELHEVILCPAGTFTSTASKTCILFFTKRKERKDVVEIVGDKRKLKFCESHSTTSVKFYDFNLETGNKEFIKEINIYDIANKKYSLNYVEYNIQEEIKNEDGIEWVELNEICNLCIGGTPLRDISEYYGGNNLWVSVKELNNNIIYDTKEHITNIGIKNSNVKLIPQNTILYSFKLSIGKIAISGKPLYTNEAIAGLIIRDNNKIVMKYLYYVLCFINTFQSKGCIGTGSLNKKSLGKIKIPIIPLEKQNKIVTFLDNLYTTHSNIKNTKSYYENNDIFRLLLDEKFDSFEKIVEWQEQSIELSKQIDFFKKRQQTYLYFMGESKDNEIKTLGEVCEIQNGKRIVKKDISIGEYPVYGGGDISFYTDTYTREGKTCKISREGMSLHNCVLLLNTKYYLNSQGMTIITKYKHILTNEYLWYYLLFIKNIIFNCGRGSGQKAIDMNKFKSIKIPIPPLEKQQEIVEYCEYNDNLIKQLEKEIENNKLLAQQFITNVLQSDSILNNIESNDGDCNSDNNDNNTANDTDNDIANSD